jgi:3-deoxy-D-manno-octulosonic-acid transferase
VSGVSGPLLASVWAAATAAGAPALRVVLRRRARRGKEIAERLGERRGVDFAPRPSGRLLWMHAASVGETMSVLPVLSELARHGPDVTTLMTTGTVTAAELLQRRLPELGLRERVLHRFAPLDVPAWVRRFLDHWRPDAASFVESEFWPNQLLSCKHRSIPVMLLNGRVTAPTAAAWSYAPALVRLMLSSFARIQARSEEDAARLRALGAAGVELPGDLKFAAPPLPADEAELRHLRGLMTGRPVWLAASIHQGEEALVAAAHRHLAQTHPELLTIIAPRQPAQGPAISAALGAPRRSAGEPPPPGGIWVADTLGELGLWYRLAPVAFVGRSLLPPGGGQNPLEPARLGSAIVVGPHTGNFNDHVALLREAGGVIEVADAQALARAVGALLDNDAHRQRMAEHAAAVVRRFADVPERIARALLDLMPRPA